MGNLRLRCRAHNQYEAERTFGAGFMAEKREQARRAAEIRDRAAAVVVETSDEDPARMEAIEHAQDVMCGLRNLGFRIDQARRAAEHSMTLPANTPLEERLRVAIKSLCPARSRGFASAAPA